MFFSTMSIPQYNINSQNYAYVEKNNYIFNLDQIFKNIIFDSNKNDYFLNNNIIGDNYIMYDNSCSRIFNELYDKKTKSMVKLLKSIDFTISSDEDGFYYSNKQYNVYVYGINQEEAENNLYEELLFQYKAYAYEDDSQLDTNAKILKYNLLSLLGNDA